MPAQDWWPLCRGPESGLCYGPVTWDGRQPAKLGRQPCTWPDCQWRDRVEKWVRDGK